MFTHRIISDVAIYKDSSEVLIKYVQHKYPGGVYIWKSIWYEKVPNLALSDNPNKNNNQSDI